eukprot:sb/3476448/
MYIHSQDQGDPSWSPRPYLDSDLRDSGFDLVSTLLSSVGGDDSNEAHFRYFRVTFCRFAIQSDPDLLTSSGERVLVVKSGSNTVNFLYRRKFILSLNRGVTKSGVTKSWSDCIDIMG